MAADGDLCVRLPEQASDDCERLVPESSPLAKAPSFLSRKRSLAVLAAAGVAALLCWPAFAWWRRAPLGPARASAPPVAGAISLASQEPNGLGGRPWEDVQANTSAPLSFFCWTLVKLGGHEETLLNFQWGRRMGIFQCADWDVVADKRQRIGGAGKEGFETTLLEGGLHDKKGQVGVACSETPGYLNSFTFMNVWVLIIKQERVWKHDFIAKLDLDAVFFPYRLPSVANPWRNKPVVFATCPNGKLWGSIEVVSRPALSRYAADLNLVGRKDDEPAIPEKCKHMTWWCWGEDEYIQECMKALGVPSVFQWNLVATSCNGGNCQDQHVAYHKFADVWAQEQCIKLAGQW